MRQTEKGFSFFEVVVAMFLMNLIIFGVAGTIVLFLKATNKSIDRSRGVIVASSLLEEYISKNRMELEDKKNKTQQYGKVNYHYDITVKKATPGSDDDYGTSVYQINITVSWQENVIGGSEIQSLKVSRSAIIQGRKKKKT